MKRNFIIIGIIISASVHAQTIDYDHFDEGKMNEVFFSQMSTYTSMNYSYSLVPADIGKKRIYRFIKMNNEKLALDDLLAEINTNILRRFDSKAISQTDLTGNVGIICRIDCHDSKTYQVTAGHCLTGWLNSENLIYMRWSQIGEAVSFYNRRTQVVYVFWAYFN